MVKVIGLDLGYDSVKTYDGKTFRTFPARAIPVDGMASDLLPKERMQIKTVDGEWFLGETAIRQGNRVISGRRHDDYVMTPIWKAMLLMAVSETLSPNTDEIEVALSLGLPFQDYRDHKSLQAVIGTHFVERPNRRKLKVKIASVFVKPQCFVVAANMKSDSLRSVVDGGGRTVGISTLQGTDLFGFTQMNCSNSEGALDVLESIAGELAGQFKVPFSTYEIAKMAQDGNYNIRVKNKPWNVEPLFDKKLSEFKDTIYTFVAKSLGDYFGRAEITMVGGAVPLLAKYMKADSRFDGFYMHQNPVYANAEALYNVGLYKVKYDA